ncbi:hypothetical protein M1N47_03020 [Dehalococcoidia bacterium]|nr:hypothetical protein [Dehalococcoidia bacterium]
MGQNLSPETIYQFIVNDFEDGWNSLAWNPSARGRGNFMFALQAMILLEFTARLCYVDPSRTALADLSRALFQVEPKYSTRLPSVCADFLEFDLPYNNSKGDELLWALFDLIRNGQAHQYQQIFVRLTDGKNWGICLTGAALGHHLELVSRSPRSPEHLGYSITHQGDLWLLLCPHLLFLDLKKAVTESGLLTRGLTFPYLTRPRTRTPKKTLLKARFYRFNAAALESSLAQAGHARTQV